MLEPRKRRRRDVCLERVDRPHLLRIHSTKSSRIMRVCHPQAELRSAHVVRDRLGKGQDR